MQNRSAHVREIVHIIIDKTSGITQYMLNKLSIIYNYYIVFRQNSGLTWKLGYFRSVSDYGRKELCQTFHGQKHFYEIMKTKICNLTRKQ